MKILFIHQNFPGQFRRLSPVLKQQGHHVLGLSMRKEEQFDGINNITYQPKRSSTPNIHPWLTSTESAIIRAETVASALVQLGKKGFTPDLIIGHGGWGELLLTKEVLPKTPVIHFCEYYYRSSGADVGFDPEFPDSEEARLRVNIRNLHITNTLLQSEANYCPTHFQANLFPPLLRQHIQVIHDGIDTEKLTPDTSVQFKLPDGTVLDHNSKLVTFINRNFEPMRGYHQFMRSIALIQEKHPDAHIVMVGNDGVSYGAKTQGESYKDRFLNEVKDHIDVSHVHFVGALPYAALCDVLRLSKAHVYLTYPFVLSWSMLEAMSLGALVIGSRTAPVEEVIQDGHNGLLVDFFSPQDIADKVNTVLAAPEDFITLRQNARTHIVEHYDFKTVCLPQQLALIQRVMS